MTSDIELRLRELERIFRTTKVQIQNLNAQATLILQAVQTMGGSATAAGSPSLGQVSITVTICGGAVDPGAAVSVTGPNSFTSSGIANSSGVYTWNYPTVGSYTVTVTPTDTTHYAVTSATYSFSSGNYSETIQCATTSSWVCVPCCSELLPASLQLSDSSFGSCSIDWDATSGAWVGSQLSTQITVSNSCASPTQGQTLVIYYLQCDSGVGSFKLSISYNGCDTTTSLYYEYPSSSSLPANPNTVPQGLFYTDLNPSSSTCSPIDLQFSVTNADLPKLYSTSSTITITS